MTQQYDFVHCMTSWDVLLDHACAFKADYSTIRR